MSTFKKVAAIVGGLVVAAIAFIGWQLFSDTQDKYERPSFDEAQIPMFDKHRLDYLTVFDAAKSLPLVGSAVFDLDKDGADELLVGNGIGQAAGLFKLTPNGFEDISEQANFKKISLDQAMYGVATIDIDTNGYTDLLVCFEGAVFLYLNEGGKFAAPQDLGLAFDSKSQPVSITYTDLNQDGHVDLFVSAYLYKDQMEGQTIFNKAGYGANSELFLNNGDNTFKKITAEAGLAYTHNTFTATFVDIDNDRHSDLVVAYDTGEPRIYKNNGNLTFSLVAHELTGKFSYPMGIAAGDYDNNGYQDFMFSNVGTSLPELMLRGDLTGEQTLVTDWILLANQGQGVFTDEAAKAKIANYEFSWGAIFEDFNHDGLQDLVVSENYVDLPNSKVLPLPARFLLQLPGHTFVNVESDNGTTNPCNGITPLVGDFNKDGWPDLAHINLDGDINAFINQRNAGNQFLALSLPNTLEYAQCKITVTLANGQQQFYQNINGEGLSSDQGRTIFIGLGQQTALPRVVLEKSNGQQQSITVEKLNQVIKL